MIISMLIYICWKIYTELVIYLKILIRKLEIPSKINMVSVTYLLNSAIFVTGQSVELE